MCMKKSDLIDSLAGLGFPLMIPEKKKSPEDISRILKELAMSDDVRLIEGFPVVLAYCICNGFELDMNLLISGTPELLENLEKLIWISAELLKKKDIELPEGLQAAVLKIKDKYDDLFSHEVILLNHGIHLSSERLHTIFLRYSEDLGKNGYLKQEQEKQHEAFKLHLFLSRLFSPKQKEIILKKYKGEPLNKTEQEYYSRKIKKKLEAVCNKEVRKIAGIVTGDNSGAGK